MVFNFFSFCQRVNAVAAGWPMRLPIAAVRNAEPYSTLLLSLKLRFIQLLTGPLTRNEKRKLVSLVMMAPVCLIESALKDCMTVRPMVCPLKTAKGGAETPPTIIELTIID